MKKHDETYESVCFPILAYELDEKDAKTTKQKIKRKLKYYGLREYDEERISVLRRLKEDLKAELQKGADSAFFAGTHGAYLDPKDFCFEKMVDYYQSKYPDIKRSRLNGIINFSVYIFYLR